MFQARVSCWSTQATVSLADAALPQLGAEVQRQDPYSSFGAFLDAKLGNTLRAIDVGTAEGRFSRNLARMYPQRFGQIIGIDVLSGQDQSSWCGTTRIDLLKGVSYRDFAQEPSNHGQFDLMFLNCPRSEVLREACLTADLILKPQGYMVYTPFWAPFLTAQFHAFSEPEDVRRGLNMMVSEFFAAERFEIHLIDNDQGYPRDIYQHMPGLVVAKKRDSHDFPLFGESPKRGKS